MMIYSSLIYLSSLSSFVYSNYKIDKPLPLNEIQFAQWLSGFIDAEGKFQVLYRGKYFRAMIRLTLHIDDIEILYKIKIFRCWPCRD